MELQASERKKVIASLKSSAFDSDSYTTALTHIILLFLVGTLVDTPFLLSPYFLQWAQLRHGKTPTSVT